MNILLWILFGALAGWIASLVMKNDASQDILMDIVMGIAGFLMQLFGVPGVTGFNLYSLLVAVVGASILIYLGRLLRRSA